MQGSEVITPIGHHPAKAGGALAIQRRRVVAVKEVYSLAGTMQNAARYCLDQGHVTPDHMEQMADLLGLMLRQLETLQVDLASH